MFERVEYEDDKSYNIVAVITRIVNLRYKVGTSCFYVIN